MFHRALCYFVCDAGLIQTVRNVVSVKRSLTNVTYNICIPIVVSEF